MTDLDRLDALAAAATPGPWTQRESSPHDVMAESRLIATCYGDSLVFDAELGAVDAAFIAACDPTTIRSLLAAVRERDELRAAAEADAHAHPCFNESCKDRKALRAALHREDGA